MLKFTYASHRSIGKASDQTDAFAVVVDVAEVLDTLFSEMKYPQVETVAFYDHDCVILLLGSYGTPFECCQQPFFGSHQTKATC